MPSRGSHAGAPLSAGAFAKSNANKHPVNLTLSDSVIKQARNYTTSLSATVEALLTDFMTAQQQTKATRLQQANGWCTGWNAVNMEVGSFANQHSTLKRCMTQFDVHRNKGAQKRRNSVYPHCAIVSV